MKATLLMMIVIVVVVGVLGGVSLYAMQGVIRSMEAENDAVIAQLTSGEDVDIAPHVNRMHELWDEHLDWIELLTMHRHAELISTELAGLRAFVDSPDGGGMSEVLAACYRLKEALNQLRHHETPMAQTIL